MGWMVATNVEKHRCIYENDDIIVEHQVICYESGDRQALMLVHLLKNELIWRIDHSFDLLSVLASLDIQMP